MKKSSSLDFNTYFKQKLALPLYQYYPHPLPIKKSGKKWMISHQNCFLDIETTFRHTFLFSELQSLPRGDPRNLCANTRIRLLLATHSFQSRCEAPVYVKYACALTRDILLSCQKPPSTAYPHGAFD